MVMVKKLYLMGNSLYLILFFSFFLSIVCDTTQSSDKINENVTVIDENDKSINSLQKINGFKPDSLINGILTLNNQGSSKNFYPKMSSEQLVTFLRESPVLIFSNQMKEEYLLAYQYEGGTENEFSCFEIGYMSDLKKSNRITHTDYKRFKLGSGLKLGLSSEELVKIKGDAYEKVENKIIYRINDYHSSNFLKRYNMPAYFLECTLSNNKIVKIKFGFDYP